MNDLAVPGFFTWSNGHMVTFTYWDLGEPTNHDGYNEDCVKMSYQVRERKKSTRLNVSRMKKKKQNYLRVCCIFASDWPMERRLLYGT